MAGGGILSSEKFRIEADEDVVSFLTRRPEDQWLDRKSARVNARHLADVMVGFANAEGGLIVIGIHDGRVEGISGAGIRATNEWRQAAVDFTEPPVRHTFELVHCRNAKGQEDQIAVVEVESSERVHTNAKGETFLRIGDENRHLGLREAQELHFDKGESSFDAVPMEGDGLSAFDQALIKKYLTAIKAHGPPEPVLLARGLVKERKGGLLPTTAGLLLLGAAPQRDLPEAFIRVLKYQGTNRETGARSNVTFDRRIEGTLPEQVRAVRRLLARHLPRATSLDRGGRFSRSTVIPEYAWLEAVVNAVTHRSYSIGGDHIRVELFDDRIEVISPGRLPGLVRIENLRSTRFARNPRIARAMSDLGFGRELGEGVNRMYEEMSRRGLPDPIYQQSSASVRVVLLSDTVIARLLERLPAGAGGFAEHLIRTGRVTTGEAMELLGVSRPTVLRHLRNLVDGGHMEHVGASDRDPHGFWRLVRK